MRQKRKKPKVEGHFYFDKFEKKYAYDNFNFVF